MNKTFISAIFSSGLLIGPDTLDNTKNVQENTQQAIFKAVEEGRGGIHCIGNAKAFPASSHEVVKKHGHLWFVLDDGKTHISIYDCTLNQEVE